MEFEESKENLVDFEKKKLKTFNLEEKTKENFSQIEVESNNFGKESLESEMSNLRINPKKRRLEGLFGENLQLKKKH